MMLQLAADRILLSATSDDSTGQSLKWPHLGFSVLLVRTKSTLWDFHDQIDNGYGFSDVEIVSINEEDDDFPVVTTDNKVQEATIASMVTIDVWPKLGTVDPSPGLKSSAKATEYGGGVIKTPPQGSTARTLTVVAQTHLVQGDKSGGRANAWTNRKILVNNGKLSKHLKKFPIVYENGQVMIPTKISENGALKWKDAIVGCFVDKRLSYFQVRSWAQRGAFSSVPVRVKLYNVSLESWTEDGLSYIASYIGNPLYHDEFTQDHSRLTFARVCIEVEAAKEIPKSFVVNLGYGEPYEIRVEFPCDICKTFGHTTNACVVKPQAPPSQVWKAKETVGQEVPVVKERITKERIGQIVPVVQEQAAKERVDGDKDEWVEVKRKKAKRTPLAISSSLCVSSTANEVGVLEICEDSGASAVVKVTNKDDAGTVPPPIVLYPVTPVTCVSTPVVQGRGSNQQELPPVALRRSTRFRKPPRIPLEGDFIGPHQRLNHVAGYSTSLTPIRGETRKKLREKIKMLKASRDKMS
ncbi:hypothetical protein RHSIM_Rhsim04G0217700 [Rhododendron simsii]|uniref:DUF4283 domain-containing protein n=1 Tax=Rhododendron simsii TaxID=118357 RepID=A0A834H316_RHOSS|nr:hypothetical protein RHSIM_Rhsim04G0217700 [Rhododendron simsii]